MIADRYASLPFLPTLVFLVVALISGAIGSAFGKRGWPFLLLVFGCVAAGAAWHHYRRDVFSRDDIGAIAPSIAHPIEIRGVMDEEPSRIAAQPASALLSMDRPASVVAVVRVTAVRQRDDWLPASGRARLVVAEPVPTLHVGDSVEVAGRLSAIDGPKNPGEFDRANFLRDQGIHAEITVRKTPDGLTRLERGWPSSFTGCLMAARAWGQEVLAEALPDDTSGVAMALVLGDGSPLTRDDWDRYVRGGVIHVLAISGQHLLVLAIFLWWVLRALAVRQRHGAAIVAVFLLLYAFLTGAHPAALRSAVTVCAVAIGLVLQRRVHPANTFALALLAVALINPADLFGTGCQLSFISVAVLYWGTRSWFREEVDPLEKLIDESRPLALRMLRWIGRQIYQSYAITAFIWIIIAPLVAARYHVVSPIGLLLGPPLALLAAVALIAGFLLLLAAAVWQPLALVFAPIVHGTLWLCNGIVAKTLSWPGSHFHVPDIPEWWLWVFYAGLLLVLTQQQARQRWRLAVVAGVGWLCVGLVAMNVRLPADELRCTFLAVGHGGCTVIETPDGRVLLYDAGAIGGPEVTQRFIAPYLWSRGIHRIDEVFLSHADLDHFNGLPALLDRFAVGLVSTTPTFADKSTPGVAETLKVISQRGIPIRVLQSGDRVTAGDVQIDVLHPPASGPDGNENARSLVLDVRHAGHRILLTGDLEGTGLERVLAMPGRPADVLMAPHHGSKVSNKRDLAEWAHPRVVVSCQGPPRGIPVLDAVYTPAGTQVLPTDQHGAVTVRSHVSGIIVETFYTGQRLVLRTSREK